MVIALLIQLLAGVSVALAAAVCLYCVGLALAAPRTRRAHAADDAPRHSFAIVIPAHNEETHIADVLNACAGLDYPHEKYRVFVVADNCRDRTAAVAAAHGATVLERHDEARRGKGAALEWALAQVLAEPVDTVVILDADCRLEATALHTFDRHLSDGNQVLQASYVAANPDESIVSYVASVANCIENDLFYAPKSRLGLAVLLRGTGMVFQRKVLEECPWRADSIVEDVEYTIRLARARFPVRFVPEAVVWSAFPAQQQQLAVQRTRWVGGNFELALRHTLPLLWDGTRLGRPVLLDLAWTLFASMRSLVLLQLFASVLLAAWAAWAASGSVSAALLGTALALVVLYALYFGAGVLRLGLTRQRMLLLLSAPGTVFRLLLIAVRSLLPGRVRSWERTPR
jgi:cellulose synthase/poly-beta-1,6-N-acetylglucosamine synthase-like glycosyltransferase